MSEPAGPFIVALCTGNAARSVMLTAYLRSNLAELNVRSRGTHAVAGMPMSWRTKAALDAHGLEAPRHRSVQFSDVDRDASLVIVMEVDHVNWIRREYPELAAVTTTLPALAEWSETWARDRRSGCSVALGPREFLYAKCTTLDVAGAPIVDDPAGGEVEDYRRVADEVVTSAHRALPFIAELTGIRQRTVEEI